MCSEHTNRPYPNSVSTHTHTHQHLERHTDMSHSARNDNNERCLIYSHCDQTSCCQSLPACSSAAQLASSDLPLVKFPLQSPKRTRQGSLMLLINLQNKTCYDYFWTWLMDEELNGLWRLLIVLWKKLYVLLIWLKLSDLLHYQRGEEEG